MNNNISQHTRCENISLTHYVARNYAQWDNSASRAKSFCARPFAALSMAVTAIIDTVAHAVFAIVKTPVAVVIGMPWSLVAWKINTRTPPQDIKITSIITHIYATAHSAVCIIALPIVLLLNPNNAASLCYHQATQPTQSTQPIEPTSNPTPTEISDGESSDEKIAEIKPSEIKKTKKLQSEPSFLNNPSTLLLKPKEQALQPASSTEQLLDEEALDSISVGRLSSLLNNRPVRPVRRPSKKTRTSDIKNSVENMTSGIASSSTASQESLTKTEPKSPKVEQFNRRNLPPLWQQVVHSETVAVKSPSATEKTTPPIKLKLSDLQYVGNSINFARAKSTAAALRNAHRQ